MDEQERRIRQVLFEGQVVDIDVYDDHYEATHTDPCGVGAGRYAIFGDFYCHISRFGDAPEAWVREGDWRLMPDRQPDDMIPKAQAKTIGPDEFVSSLWVEVVLRKQRKSRAHIELVFRDGEGGRASVGVKTLTVGKTLGYGPIRVVSVRRKPGPGEGTPDA